MWQNQLLGVFLSAHPMLFSAQQWTPLSSHVFTILCFICCCSVSKSCLTLCDPMDYGTARLSCSSLSPGACSDSLLLSQWCHLIICCPFLLPPSIFPSIRVFSNESALRIRCPKYWSFGFSISPSSEYSGFPLGLTGLFSPIFCTYL